MTTENEATTATLTVSPVNSENNRAILAELNDAVEWMVRNLNGALGEDTAERIATFHGVAEQLATADLSVDLLASWLSVALLRLVDAEAIPGEPDDVADEEPADDGH